MYDERAGGYRWAEISAIRAANRELEWDELWAVAMKRDVVHSRLDGVLASTNMFKGWVPPRHACGHLDCSLDGCYVLALYSKTRGSSRIVADCLTCLAKGRTCELRSGVRCKPAVAVTVASRVPRTRPSTSVARPAVPQRCLTANPTSGVNGLVRPTGMVDKNAGSGRRVWPLPPRPGSVQVQGSKRYTGWSPTPYRPVASRQLGARSQPQLSKAGPLVDLIGVNDNSNTARLGCPAGSTIHHFEVILRTSLDNIFRSAGNLATVARLANDNRLADVALRQMNVMLDLRAIIETISSSAPESQSVAHRPQSW